MLRKNPISSSAFNYGRHKRLQFRLFSSIEKIYELSGRRKQRLDMLTKVYSPLMIHKEGSQEWTKLIKSGKSGRTTFVHLSFQAEYSDFLKAIDGLKGSSKVSSVDLLQGLTVGFTQQSCAIEGNTLGLKETQKVWNSLNKNCNLSDFLKNQEMLLPAPSVLSDKPENEVIEIRNHLLATYFLYNISYKWKHEIDFDGIKKIHRILLKDTRVKIVKLEEGQAYDYSLHQHAGEFRKLEVEARGSVSTVYPLPMEVPALMERFIQFWYESKNSGLHPLIIASRILSTFLHIHPFIDGNEHVGRLIMALYLIRNGYPPIIFQDINREEYGSTLFLAQTEKDSIPLYALVVQTIFNILMRYQE
ncbi:1564_t:CDS:2 [Acaulospora morrowiae]|uniref:1564_t:CDS:1 n=1 Tax=Acaulospora morrowiae TaxID=94023 RepID=A0A9N9CF18_9GLOM|nr:1564_t:CDS:2 [Acaulospora morrowiae]